MQKSKTPSLRLKGVRTNNLKNIDVEIPLKGLTVITGVSGSGKSSLAFETIYAEGQRRYVESLSTYTRQFLEKMARPELDSAENIRPAIALEQKNHVTNSRSTVATMSDLYDYLRILYAKTADTFCLRCQQKVSKDSPQSIAMELPAGFDKFYITAPMADWEKEKQSLVAKGFVRILFPQIKDGKEIFELVEISELLRSTMPSAATKEKAKAKTKTKVKTQKPASPPMVVIDRISRPEDPVHDQRLMEALEEAFRLGNGFLTLVAPSGEDWLSKNYSDRFQCENCGIPYDEPSPPLFSFNSPLGACEDCSGFGFNLELSENIIVPQPKKTLREGAVDPFTKPAYDEYQFELLRFCHAKSIPVNKRYQDLSEAEKELIWNGDGGKKGFQGIRGAFEELKAWKYKMHVRIFIRRYQEPKICRTCQGKRLKPKIEAYKLSGRSITELLALSLKDAQIWFHGLKLDAEKTVIAKDALAQISNRLDVLNHVGVGYLALDRLGKTLSGGECQRIALGSQLGNRLCSTLYVLDEPSIGLHAADTQRMIDVLLSLRDLGNTVIVVEHDLDVISNADYFIELGPHAGYRGGNVVIQGDFQKLLTSSKRSESLTMRYLSGEKTLALPSKRRLPKGEKNSIRITGAREHNLKNIDAEFPLGVFLAVTGVSGSGKTTLVQRTLYNALRKVFDNESVAKDSSVGRFDRMYGVDLIRNVVLLDQKPIGKSSRSNPATYLGIYDDIRKVYCGQSLSLQRGYTPRHFSFNVDGGRCPICKGEGEVTIDMHFMSDLKLPCEECGGKRFTKPILEVEFQRKNIFALLNTTIDECYDIFREHPNISTQLQTLRSVGLGYLLLGQSATSLSGGESQRLKIASVLQENSGKKAGDQILYIFDEPTTGLHIDDVGKLVKIFHDLVDFGNSVLVVEHNLDVIAQADLVMDLGPGAGEEGGNLVGCMAPEELANVEESLTGQYLKKYFAARKKFLGRSVQPTETLEKISL